MALTCDEEAGVFSGHKNGPRDPNLNSQHFRIAIIPSMSDIRASQVVLVVKNPPAKGRGRESGRSPGGGHGRHSSILAWRIPWTEKPGRLQSMGWQRVGHDWATNTFTPASMTLIK